MRNFQFKVGQEALNVLRNYQGPVVGISTAAYARIVPSFFLTNYRQFCLKDSLDLNLIRKFSQVTLFERDKEEVFSYKEVIHLPQNIEFFKKLGQPELLVYHSREELEEVAQKYGFKILANPVGLYNFFGEKKNFRKILQRIGVKSIPGEVLKVKELLSWDKVRKLKKRYGEELVFQFAEFGSGGSGTFFVKSKQDFQIFITRLKELQTEEFIEKYGENFPVIVAQFISGPSPSMTGCATRFGILAGILQTQVLGIPELLYRENKGSFCGHDWYYNKEYSFSLQKQAEKVIKRVGDYLYKKGYRGIFGIDFILDEQTQTLYPVECNPRYTGAFPVYAFLQMEQGEPPFDAFHLLELADLDYELNFKDLQELYRRSNKKGAHVRLRNKNDFNVKVNQELESGIYKLEQGELRFLRPGLFPWEIEKKGEFLLTGGLPRKDMLILPHARLGSLIFKGPILRNRNSLRAEIIEVIRMVYKSWQIKEVGNDRSC